MSLDGLVKTYKAAAEIGDHSKFPVHGFDNPDAAQGSFRDSELAKNKVQMDASRSAAGKVQPPPVATPPEPSWATKQGLPSTGSNVGDAAIAGGVGMAGLYGAYQLLRDKKHSED